MTHHHREHVAKAVRDGKEKTDLKLHLLVLQMKAQQQQNHAEGEN